MKKLGKQLPKLQRYDWANLAHVNVFTHIPIEDKGDAIKLFGTQFVSRAKKTEQGTNLRCCLFDLAKMGLDEVKSWDDKFYENWESGVLATSPLEKNFTDSHIEVTKEWYNGEFNEFHASLVKKAREMKLKQGSRTKQPATFIYRKSDLFAHLVKIAIDSLKSITPTLKG